MAAADALVGEALAISPWKEALAERDALAAALRLIIVHHARKEVHLGPVRWSGLEQGCIRCIAEMALRGEVNAAAIDAARADAEGKA